MSKKIRDTNLKTPVARKQLAPSPNLYLQEIERRCYLGYLKGKGGGVWTARLSRRRKQDKEAQLALADDQVDADGIKVMDFDQARTAARNWCAEQLAKEAMLPPDDRPFMTAGPACGRD